VRKGAGGSDSQEASFLEYGGRLLVTERTQAIGVGMGGAYLRWLRPGVLMASIMPGLGVERFRDKPFMNLSLHGSLGTGFVLKEGLRRDRSWALTPEMVGLPDGTISVVRGRFLLTLDVTGAIDARTTRQPLYGIGILVGLAWIAERYEVDVPEPFDPMNPLLSP
jgi:hypothetical protein